MLLFSQERAENLQIECDRKKNVKYFIFLIFFLIFGLFQSLHIKYKIRNPT